MLEHWTICCDQMYIYSTEDVCTNHKCYKTCILRPWFSNKFFSITFYFNIILCLSLICIVSILLTGTWINIHKLCAGVEFAIYLFFCATTFSFNIWKNHTKDKFRNMKQKKVRHLLPCGMFLGIFARFFCRRQYLYQ